MAEHYLGSFKAEFFSDSRGGGVPETVGGPRGDAGGGAGAFNSVAIRGGGVVRAECAGGFVGMWRPVTIGWVFIVVGTALGSLGGVDRFAGVE